MKELCRRFKYEFKERKMCYKYIFKVIKCGCWTFIYNVIFFRESNKRLQNGMKEINVEIYLISCFLAGYIFILWKLFCQHSLLVNLVYLPTSNKLSGSRSQNWTSLILWSWSISIHLQFLHTFPKLHLNIVFTASHSSKWLLSKKFPCQEFLCIYPHNWAIKLFITAYVIS